MQTGKWPCGDEYGRVSSYRGSFHYVALKKKTFYLKDKGVLLMAFTWEKLNHFLVSPSTQEVLKALRVVDMQYRRL